MPGFGLGPFGGSPFGEWDWSTQVFWTYLPEVYRLQDTTGLLSKWLSAVQELFDYCRIRARDFSDLRDPYALATQYQDEHTLRLGEVLSTLGGIEQAGIDGMCLTLGAFQAASARFVSQDRGKLLFLQGSTVPANNRLFTIASVVNGTTVVTDPVIAVDAGPLKWKLRSLSTGDPDILWVEVDQGDPSDFRKGSILTDGYADWVVQDWVRFRTDDNYPPCDKTGSDGVLSGGLFVSPRAPFFPSDVGKRLLIANSVAVDAHYRIAAVVSDTQVVLTEEDGTVVTLADDAGPLFWAVTPIPEIALEGRKDLKGYVEQGGTDLEVLSGTTVQSVTALFSSADVGKLLTIENAVNAANNATFEILSIINANRVVLDTAVLLVETDLTWSVRAKTLVGDQSQVRVHSPSYLQHLAYDFGLTLDTQESEIRQRGWVGLVSRWVDKKGTETAYWMMARLSGFDVTVYQLYRLDLDLVTLVPSADLYEIGEADPSRYGTNGSIILSTFTHFSSPTAVFASTDVGKVIEIAGAATPWNNKYFQIASVQSSTEVVFRLVDGGTTDANNGALVWSILTLYTSLPPKIARFDEVRADLLTEIVDAESGSALEFTLDKYCWEADWGGSVPITITAATYLSANLYVLAVQSNTVGPYPDAPEVVADVGQWFLTDSLGNELWLETVPSGGPSYAVQVRASSAPSLGDGFLSYSCVSQPSCLYAPASRMVAIIETAEIALETGLAVEKAQERVIRRLLEEVKPIHVQLVPILRAELRATMLLSATVTGALITSELVAPLTAQYDTIYADDIETDHVLRVTFEIP